MPSAAELGVKINTERQEFAKWMSDHKAADGTYDLSGDNLAEFNKRDAALSKMVDDLATQKRAEEVAAENETKMQPQGRMVASDHGVKDDGPVSTKAGLDFAFKSAFAKHGPAIKAYREGDAPIRFNLGVGLKTIVDLTTSYDAHGTPVGRAESALFFGDVEPLFPHSPISSDAAVGWIQSTDTDNAAAVAEHTAATDSAFVWTKTTDEIEDVQTWIPASRNLLSDEPQMQGVITGMLARRLQKKSSGYILTGTGTTPVPWGVFIRTGFQTQAKGTDPTFDAIHKAITKVSVTGDADPNLACFHPNDWQDIRLTRTTDGLYILGNPSEDGPRRIWGLPVVLSTGMTEHTGGVVDTSFTTIFENGGVVVEVSTEHSTYFTERTIAIALVRRFGAFHYRPSAAATITGI